MKVVELGNKKLILKQGDITEEDVDAIVNAANPTLMGGGGVDGAIHKKGGKRILEECIQIRRTQYPDGLPTGEAVITTGGNLKAKYVIHTVGPICEGGKLTDEKKALLRNAYYNSLKLADEKGLRRISFPSISTGAYGCPVKESSEVALKTALDFLKEAKSVEEINFVLFTPDVYDTYAKSLEKILNRN